MKSPTARIAVVTAAMALLGGIAVAGLPEEPSTVRLTEPVAPSSTAPASSDPTADPIVTAETPMATDPSTVPASTPSTLATDSAPPDRSAVSIIVANAARVDGAALAVSATLLELGYRFVVAADALEPRDTTVVLYSPGNLATAERLATDLGLDADIIAPLGDDPLTDGPTSADVVVLLAADVAL